MIKENFIYLVRWLYIIDKETKKLLKERDKLCQAVAKDLYNLRRGKIGKWEKMIN